MDQTGRQRPPDPAHPSVPPKRNPILRIVRLIAGWILVGVGILGLFLPVLQGVLMIAGGLAILSGESEFIRRLLKRFTPHFRLWRWRYNSWRAKRKAKREGR